jgi:hypothetical protein
MRNGESKIGNRNSHNEHRNSENVYRETQSVISKWERSFGKRTMDNFKRDCLLPEFIFTWSMGLFDKSTACSRQFQNSTFGLKQLELLILRFAVIYSQKAP